MGADAFRYDVGLSFLAEDEPLAQELADTLQESLRVFIYSKQQESLAGKDGEEVFSRVFGHEARIVAVLYRQRWGETPWTRIEETAIRNRAFDKGYDFATFVPLEQPVALPEWLPKSRIWLDLARWGVQGAAAVLEARAREAGSTPHTETAVEVAHRKQREIERAERRKGVLESSEGVRLATTALIQLFKRLDAIADEIASKLTSLEIAKGGMDRTRVYTITNSACPELTDSSRLTVGWSQQFGNSLQYSQLSVHLWRGKPGHVGIRPGAPARPFDERRFHFDLDSAGAGGWREIAGKRRFSTSDELANECMKLLVSQVGTGTPADRDSS
jgi:hypothetical protein